MIAHADERACSQPLAKRNAETQGHWPQPEPLSR
jgi:hypothetical protein